VETLENTIAMNNAHEQKLEHIISRMQADRSVDAPADALKYVKNLFKTRAPEPSLMTRIVAVLKVDLAPNRAAFGERSGGGEARQMLFESGDNAVDIRIAVVDGGFDIRGQILGDGFASGDAGVENSGFSTSSVIDDIGGFRLSSIPAGEYSLTLRDGKSEIVIEGLKLA